MERTAARRVALESAADAMQRQDLKRLKMLDVWVRHRAQVVLFASDDLKALELAIDCLETSRPSDERRAAVDEIQSGELRKPTRDLCLAEDDAQR